MYVCIYVCMYVCRSVPTPRLNPASDMKRLRSLLAQLRKAANHPYLFPHSHDEEAPTGGKHMYVCMQVVFLCMYVYELIPYKFGSSANVFTYVHLKI